MESYIEFTTIDKDPRFGKITILYNKEDPRQRVMKKIQAFQNQQEYEHSKEQVHKRMHIYHDNILEMIDYSFNDKEMVTIVYFDYPENTLDLQQLNENDSVKVFGDVLKAIVYLQNSKMVHGDIRPEFIYKHPLKNCYVLLDRLMETNTPLQCQLNNLSKQKSLFMAPKIFEELINKSKKIRQNSYKSELFSLGILCIGIIEGQDFVQTLYDQQSKKFKDNLLQEKLDVLLKRNYPQLIVEFLNFLKNQVLVEEERRINPKKIFKFVQNTELAKVFYFDDDIQSQNDTVMSTSLQYYNPMDFVEDKGISIEFQKTLTETQQSIDQEEISKLIIGSSEQLFEKKKESILKMSNDQKDSLNSLKFLNIRLCPVKQQQVMDQTQKNPRISTRSIKQLDYQIEEKVNQQEEQESENQRKQSRDEKLISDQNYQETISEDDVSLDQQELDMVDKELTVSQNETDKESVQIDFRKEWIQRERVSLKAFLRSKSMKKKEDFDFDKEIVLEEEHESNQSPQVQKEETVDEMKNFFQEIGINEKKEPVESLQQLLEDQDMDFNNTIEMKQKQEKTKLKHFLQKQPSLSLRRMERQSVNQQRRNYGFQKLYSINQIKDKKDNIKIEQNFQLMNINPNKQMDKKFRKSIKERLQDKDQMFFNIDNLSRSISPKRSKSCRRFENNEYEELQEIKLGIQMSEDKTDRQIEKFSQKIIEVFNDEPERRIFPFPADLILREISFKIQMILMSQQDNQFNRYLRSMKSIEELDLRQSQGSLRELQREKNFMTEDKPYRKSNEEFNLLQQKYSQRKNQQKFQKFDIDYITSDDLRNQVLNRQQQRDGNRYLEKQISYPQSNRVNNVLKRRLVKGENGRYFYEMINQNLVHFYYNLIRKQFKDEMLINQKW